MNEKVVVWDDFRGKSYMFSETLKLLDRYPYKIEIKIILLLVKNKLKLSIRLYMYTKRTLITENYH